jgi:hypothetical protein
MRHDCLSELEAFFQTYKDEGVEPDFHITADFAWSMLRVLKTAKRNRKRLNNIKKALK